MAHTWQDDNGSFWPGRLDFFIYPDSVIKPLHQFILNTRTMTSEELSAAGLEPDDSVLSSDHLPLVVDFLVINN